MSVLLQALGDLAMATECRPRGDDYSGAIFGRQTIYRYALWRRLAYEDQRICLFVMLNPSTADELDLDPTLRRCFWYTKFYGCSTMLIGNLYAYRATQPKDMLAQPSPVGPDNNRFLEVMLTETFRSDGIAICGWGNNAEIEREGDFLQILRRAALAAGKPEASAHCLIHTKQGRPGHPGRIANGLPLQVWR